MVSRGECAAWAPRNRSSLAGSVHRIASKMSGSTSKG